MINAILVAIYQNIHYLIIYNNYFNFANIKKIKMKGNINFKYI